LIKIDLYNEFKDLETTAHLRENAAGKIAVISCLYFVEDSENSRFATTFVDRGFWQLVSG
jgi:hypothetical protein